MVYKIFLWGFFSSLICYNLFAQSNNTDEYKRVLSNKPAYLKKAEKKIRKSECYRTVKKKYPSIVNGKTQIIYSLSLKKRLTREEFTYSNVMDNLEFQYHNSRKFPDNHVSLYDTTANVEITYEEGWGFSCLYDVTDDGSGASELKKYIIPVHVTIDNMQPDFVFTLDNVGGIYFFVKEDEIFVLLSENKLMNLSDFVENYYDEYVKYIK